MESRTQGSRPRPRTQKKSEAKAKAKDSLSEDRHSRGQGQECSRPRPRTKDTKRKCSPKKKKKRSSQKFFKRSPRKNAFQKIFQPLHKILTFQKIVLSSSRGQANFRGLEASRPRPRPRTSKSVLEAKDVLEDSTSGIKRSHIEMSVYLFLSVIAPSFFILIICRCWASNTFLFPIFCSNQKKKKAFACSFCALYFALFFAVLENHFFTFLHGC